MSKREQIDLRIIARWKAACDKYITARDGSRAESAALNTMDKTYEQLVNRGYRQEGDVWVRV
jgi:hypothetical protein